jgi:transcriptional regulator with XRE-family HTH domain
MERLKELRRQAGFTQAQLAQMLRTTQQTVGRWESGKVEPDIATLRDLAMIYGTSVDDILGQNPLTGAKTITSNHVFFRGDEEGEKGCFWGHLGVRFPGQSKSSWYPITLSQDEAADQPDDDWELPWDGPAGLPQEMYPALVECGMRGVLGEADEGGYSEAFRRAIEDVIKEHALDGDSISDRIAATCVTRRDGTVERMTAEGGCLWELVENAKCDALPAMFALEDNYGAIDIYFPTQAVCCVDMPLHEVMNAAQRVNEQIDKELEETDNEPEELKGKLVQPALPAPRKRGRPRKIAMSEVVSEGVGK